MKINKITLGAEASYKFQKATIAMEIENATQEEIATLQQQLNTLAVKNAREIASQVEDKQEVKTYNKPANNFNNFVPKPTTTSNNGEMKYTKGGKPMMSKDGVHMTVAEFEKAQAIGKPSGKAPWEFTIAEVR